MDKHDPDKYVDITDPRCCAYKYGTTLYLDMLDKESGTGIVFYNKSMCQAPEKTTSCEIACGPRSKYTEEQLKLIQSLWRFGCRTKMKKNNVRVFFNYSNEGQRDRLLNLLKQNDIECSLNENTAT